MLRDASNEHTDELSLALLSSAPLSAIAQPHARLRLFNWGGVREPRSASVRDRTDILQTPAWGYRGS